MQPRKILVGVGGRFTADRMASSYASFGHDVCLVSTLPKSRFLSAPNLRIASFIFPELAYRLGKRIGLENPSDFLKMKMFGKYLASAVERENPDVLFGWSSFSTEAFRSPKKFLRVLVRESSHIDVQDEILRGEYEQLGKAFIERAFCVEREREEYANADRILVCSEFAKKSFLLKGFPEEKIQKITLGADTTLFGVESDCVRSTGPLRIIYFGSISVRKGVRYLLEATKGFSSADLDLTLIGSVEPGYEKILAKYSHFAIFPSMSHAQLAKVLPDYDVFVLPSLEDGFGLVVPQAMASGLVPVVTDRCGSSEILENGRTGIVIEGANASAIREALGKLVRDRRHLLEMRNETLKASQNFGWENYTVAVNRILNGLIGQFL